MIELRNLLAVSGATVLTILPTFFVMSCTTLTGVMPIVVRAKVEDYAGNHDEAVKLLCNTSPILRKSSLTKLRSLLLETQNALEKRLGSAPLRGARAPACR